MIITSIKVQNFRGIREFEAADITSGLLVVGQMGSGKSSLLQAIQFCLYGRCFDELGRRILNENLFTHGHTESSVSLDIADVAVDDARRWKLSAKIKIANRLGAAPTVTRSISGPGCHSKTGLDDFWRGALGVSLEFAECIGNPRTYLHDPAMLGFITTLNSGGISEQSILDYASDRADWLKAAWQVSPVIWPPQSKEDVEAFGRHCYEVRTEANAALKQAMTLASAPAEMPKKPDGTPFTSADLPAIEKALQTLADERAGHEAALRNVMAAEISHGIDPAVLRKKIETRETEFRAAATVMRKAKERLQEVTTKIDSLRSKSSDLSASMFKDKKVPAVGSKCPVCCREIGADAAANISARNAERKREFDSIEREIEGLRLEKREAEAALDAAQSKVASLAAEEDALRKQLESVEAAAGETKETRTKAEIEAAIAETDARIQKGRDARAALTIAQTAAAQAETTIESLESQIDNLDWAVAAFSKGDFLACLDNSTAFDEFIGSVNSILGGYGLKLGLGSNKIIHLYHLSENLPVRLCEASKGEQIVCAYAVAQALDRRVPVILDDLEALSSAVKPKVFAALRQREASCILGAAWGLAAEPDAGKLAAALAPIRCAVVEAGKISQLA